MEQGSYEERRLYKLDLFEREPAEAAAILARYLTRSKVESGEALETARSEYRSRNRRVQARAAIPDAWKELVEKGDELLVEMIASAVESKAGIRPDDDDVTDFLASLGKTAILQPTLPQTAPRPTIPQPTPRTPPTPEPGASTRAGMLVLRGRASRYANAKEAMVKVLTELASEDPTFLQRCSQHPDAQGTRRRYIAKTPEELYPNRPDLREHREQLPGGWLVATNLNNPLKKAIIRLAAEVAGIRFGHDVTVEF